MATNTRKFLPRGMFAGIFFLAPPWTEADQHAPKSNKKEAVRTVQRNNDEQWSCTSRILLYFARVTKHPLAFLPLQRALNASNTASSVDGIDKDDGSSIVVLAVDGDDDDDDGEGDDTCCIDDDIGEATAIVGWRAIAPHPPQNLNGVTSLKPHEVQNETALIYKKQRWSVWKCSCWIWLSVLGNGFVALSSLSDGQTDKAALGMPKIYQVYLVKRTLSVDQKRWNLSKKFDDVYSDTEIDRSHLLQLNTSLLSLASS